MKISAKSLAVGAVTAALTVVFGAMPYVFLIPVLFTCVTRSGKAAFAESLFFGVVSLCFSFASASPVAAAFVEHPWLPILPRIFVGMASYGAYAGLRALCRRRTGKLARALPVVVACAVGPLVNTGLIVPLLWAVSRNVRALGAVWVSTTLLSGVIEWVACVAVVPSLAFTVGKALRLPAYLPPAPTEETCTAAPTEEGMAAEEGTATEESAPTKESETYTAAPTGHERKGV